ncbi:hypothetical protein GIB67_035797 [Kingdonia uniflora]|uniref:Protein kinase domain-containing protein n=1 Tax=Kingdonia uniflora TaxID=39325 RepID=A0A7J7MJT8_9MAGN|nr:hypothetical protein GIB67_035797 [Kingdonia uniflora]
MIKILDFERTKSDLKVMVESLFVLRARSYLFDMILVFSIQKNITREAQTMILVDHPNVLKAHCSFVHEHTLWVIMPFMDGGSCLHILKAAYPNGFGEVVIATFLREVLKGLEYLHHHGHIHRDVKAGNILVGARGAIKLGDFGVSACMFDSGDRQRTRNTFVGTPCWMAPEVMEQLYGYDFKADIWSFGITALELAHGHAPFSKYPPMKILLMTLQHAPPCLNYERDKKFSRSFKEMIAMCLVKEPSKRPSAHKLLKHPFFKQARSNDYIARTILEGLPSIAERLEALKRKDADMLAQKKMPDGEKEEISQNEYKRGISSWNFNIEDMKAQAALIQDGEESISNKDGSSSSSQDMNDQGASSSTSHSFLDDVDYREDEGFFQNRPAPPQLVDLTTNNLKARCDRYEELSISGSSYGHNASQDSLLDHDDHFENGWAGKSELRRLESMDIHSPHKKRVSSSTILPCFTLSPLEVDSDKQQTHGKNMESCNGTGVPHTADTSNGEDIEEKGKKSIVQQRGRFKVTSESVDLDKALLSPVLQKSHSVQLITQLPGAFPPSDATSSSLVGNSVFKQLHYVLQTNILQREGILGAMKQLSTGDKAVNPMPDGGQIPVHATVSEKSLLEAAHDREKTLLQELAKMQGR